jgi:hypothetical protein
VTGAAGPYRAASHGASRGTCERARTRRGQESPVPRVSWRSRSITGRRAISHQFTAPWPPDGNGSCRLPAFSRVTRWVELEQVLSLRQRELEALTSGAKGTELASVLAKAAQRPDGKRADSARRIRRVGRRWHGPGPSRRPDHLVRTAPSRLSRCPRRSAGRAVQPPQGQLLESGRSRALSVAKLAAAQSRGLPSRYSRWSAGSAASGSRSTI